MKYQKITLDSEIRKTSKYAERVRKQALELFGVELEELTKTQMPRITRTTYTLINGKWRSLNSIKRQGDKDV